jgi:membrane protein
MNKKKEKIKGSIKRNFQLMQTPLMTILPGQISFFVILSIIPLVSIIVMIIQKLSFSFDSITNFISHYLPGGVTNIIITIFEQQRATSFDLLFILMAFYLASKATHSIIIASTQIYNGEQRDFFRTRIKAIFMLFILVILGIILIGLFVLGGRFMYYLSTVNQDIHSFVFPLYKILKWPFIFFSVFFTVKVIYTLAPNCRVPSSSVTKGALITTIIWVITTYVFSFYITNIANYTKFYGALSNLIMLMIWIYWLCIVFVFGMTFNEDKLSHQKK